MTTGDLLREALMTAGVIGAADPATDAQLNVALNALVGLIDTSNADPLAQLTTVNRSFTLVPPRQNYTIGPDSSLDIKAPRPSKILRATAALPSGYSDRAYQYVRVLNWSEYAQAGIRNVLTPSPTALWYDGGSSAITAPLNPPSDSTLPLPSYGTIHFIGIPSTPSIIEIWSASPLTQATSYVDDLIFPPGYYEYLLYGTTIRLYPRFGRPVDGTVADLYKDARLKIESANVSPAAVSRCDSGIPGSGGSYWDGRSNGRA